jgi:hypothetical protein
MRLDEAVPGDGIRLPHWPHRVTVLGIHPDGGGTSRVFWAGDDPSSAEGVTRLGDGCLTERHWDFKRQSRLKTLQPGPIAAAEVLALMTEEQERNWKKG